MRKLILGLVVLAAILLFSVPIFADGPVRVGVYNNQPLSFMREDGTPQGIYIDVLREIARAKKWDIEFVSCEWSACLAKLEAGDIDILGPIAYSDDRAEKYDFTSGTLLVNWGQVYVPPGSNIESFLDLREKTVAVLGKDIHYQRFRELLRRFGISVNYVEVDDYDSVMALVAAGQVDAGLVNRIYGIQREGDFNVKKSPIVLNPIEIRFATAKGKHAQLLADIDDQLAEMKNTPDSAYYQTIEHWLAGTAKPQLPAWLLWAMGIALGGGILLLVATVVLRRQVQLRTRALQQEIEEHKHTAAALAASEARYRNLVENAPLPIFVHRDGKFVYLNPAAVEIHGVASADELIGTPLKDFLLPAYIPQLEKRLSEAAAGATHVRVSETKIKRADGAVVDVIVSAMPVDFAGTPAQLTILQDITDRKRAEEQLRAYAIELERSNRELQDFAYVASHDLQEPLRKIQVFGERLQTKYRDTLDETAQDYLTRMEDAASRMKKLIQDLLAFSRVTTHAKPFTPVDLNEVVTGVLQDLETRITETGATVQVGQLPTIEADSTQMRQLFQNLIGNAIKFHRDGVPPVVTISAECLPDDTSARDLCRITVADNGIGFDPKYLDRVFAVFQRLHSRNEYPGTGVGLALCRKIVLRHQGTITADSTPGEGSTFIVMLPTRQRVPISAE